jgi:hypothetical protein
MEKERAVWRRANKIAYKSSRKSSCAFETGTGVFWDLQGGVSPCSELCTATEVTSLASTGALVLAC